MVLPSRQNAIALIDINKQILSTFDTKLNLSKD